MADYSLVYEAHVDRVYGFFAFRVRNRVDAEDLTQLTFERALRAWGRYDARRASVSVWLLSIARNLLIDHYRADRSTRQEDLEALAKDEPTADLVVNMGLDPRLERGLSELSQRDREIIALRYGADLSGPEIAGITGLSLANVQQIVSRSLRRLRSALEDPPIESKAPPSLEATQGASSGQ